MVCVGTPPSEIHVARISQWHVTRIIGRIAIIRISLKIQMMHFSYPDCLKEGQTTLIKDRHPDGFHNTSAPQYIRITNMGYPDMIVQIIDWSKTSVDPRLVTCRVRGRVEVTTSHFPRSFYMITSHDLWQPHHLPRSLIAARRVMMALLPPNVIMTT